MARRSDRVAPRRVDWSARALRDLEEISDYISRDDEPAAARWVDKLIAAAEPMMGRRVPEMDRDDVRERLVHAYRVVYWIHEEHIEILTVFEGHRRLVLAVPRRG